VLKHQKATEAGRKPAAYSSFGYEETNCTSTAALQANMVNLLSDA